MVNLLNRMAEAATAELTLFDSGLLGKVTEIPRFWYAVPLIIAVALVYGATRHEYLNEIVFHSIKSLIWVAGFMGIIWAVIFAAGFWT